MAAHFLLEASPTSAFLGSLSPSLFWPQVSALSVSHQKRSDEVCREAFYHLLVELLSSGVIPLTTPDIWPYSFQLCSLGSCSILGVNHDGNPRS